MRSQKEKPEKAINDRSEWLIDFGEEDPDKVEKIPFWESKIEECVDPPMACSDVPEEEEPTNDEVVNLSPIPTTSQGLVEALTGANGFVFSTVQFDTTITELIVRQD